MFSIEHQQLLQLVPKPVRQNPDQVVNARVAKFHKSIETGSWSRVEEMLNEREIPLDRFYIHCLDNSPFAGDIQHIIYSYIGVYDPLMRTPYYNKIKKNGNVTTLMLSQILCQNSENSENRMEVHKELILHAEETALYDYLSYCKKENFSPLPSRDAINARLFQLEIGSLNRVHNRLSYNEYNLEYEQTERTKGARCALYQLVHHSKTATNDQLTVISTLFLEKVNLDDREKHPRIFAPVSQIEDARYLKDIIELSFSLVPSRALTATQEKLQKFHGKIEKELLGACRKRARSISRPLDEEENRALVVQHKHDTMVWEQQKQQIMNMAKVGMLWNMLLFYHVSQFPSPNVGR